MTAPPASRTQGAREALPKGTDTLGPGPEHLVAHGSRGTCTSDTHGGLWRRIRRGFSWGVPEMLERPDMGPSSGSTGRLCTWGENPRAIHAARSYNRTPVLCTTCGQPPGSPWRTATQPWTERQRSVEKPLPHVDRAWATQNAHVTTCCGCSTRPTTTSCVFPLTTHHQRRIVLRSLRTMRAASPGTPAGPITPVRQPRDTHQSIGQLRRSRS